jgi:hypothetical protein
MAINQLQLPSSQAFSGGIDWSPLPIWARSMSRRRPNSSFSKRCPAASTHRDPKSLSALAARVLPYDSSTGLSLASLASTAANTQYQHGRDTTNDEWREQEAARAQGNTDRSYGLQANADARAAQAQALALQKQKDEIAADANWRGTLTGLYGNGQQPPARPPVQSSPTVWGDKEAQAAGLYETPPGAPAQARPVSPVAGLAAQPAQAQQDPPTGVPVPQAVQAQPVGPPGSGIAPAPQDQSAAQPAVPLVPAAAGFTPRAIQLIAAAGSPRLPQADRDVAKTLLANELDASKLTTDQKNWAAAKAQDPSTPDITTWMRANRAAGKTEVNVDTQGAGAFAKAAGGAIAKRFEDLSKEGDTGTTDLALIGQLRDLGNKVQTGTPAAIQGWLANNGIKVGDNVGAVEAYGAIIDKLTPSQRIPGSGSTSDYEGAMFKRSLPNLLKTPEGNDIVQNTLAGLAQTKV